MFSFTLELAGINELSDEVANALFEAGCDDATLSMSGGRAFLDFDRESDSISDAIVSAIDAVEKCGRDIRVVEVIPPSRSTYDLVNAFLCLRDQFPDASLVDLSRALHSASAS
ncbi:MAG: hypothetical protein R3C10_20650 [Pirellulales bacterium]|nr:hypothetical protein [Planctomycetales bacterium]